MPKEMIVSVNGREKKIAVIDNGLVTEFYIERGEGGDTGAGIVGNIYKGRVQRVLPGMQSAFVDIGLERDAFLYVSDFFDEEEDVERVAITTKNTTNAENAAHAVGARESANTISAAPPALAAPAIIEDRSERDAEPDAGRRGRRRGRGRDGERTRDDSREGASREPRNRDSASRPEVRQDAAPSSETFVTHSDEIADVTSERPSLTSRIDTDDAPRSGRRSQSRSTGFVRPEPVRPEEIATPFVAPADFERISDPEEDSETAGDLLKDAIIQDRLTDQTRRVEFDLPAQTPHTIGSLLESSAAASAPASFERISDDEADAQAAADTGRTSPKVVAAKALFQEAATEDDSAPAPPASTSFERISDDESTASSADAKIPAKQTSTADDAADDGTRSRRTRSRRGGSKQEAAETIVSTTDDATAVSPVDAVSDATIAVDAANEPEAASGRKRRGTGRAAAKTASEPTANRTRRTRRTEATADAAIDPDAAQTAGDSAESGDLFADADASVKGSSSRGEFARRRRRGGRRPNDGTNGENGEGEEGDAAATDSADAPDIIGSDAAEEKLLAVSSADDEDDEDFAPVVDDVSDMIAAETTLAEPNGADVDTGNVAPANTSGGSDFGAHRGISGTTLNPGSAASGDNRRGSRDGRERSSGGRAGGGGRERRPAPPAISDLLREGQEVLVQIAKEPIATKGARITSHVALPGRFLVYMPTVEHVGVSRKIESDSERQRLRKMIATIRNEEDVPSGGFIVRTAGTNITEQDLREDARYLVRTWRDIRRSAERAKSPALVHKDLDLVQRLLRDQLSEEFTAIRVDSEEEYLQVVEFVNRIQPRLVNRVKLHTRDEPIMETYGVQAEIDKAIKPRVWLKSGGYLVINQTEALVAIDVNTGKFVGRGGSRLEDTITKTNMEAVDEIARQIRLRDLGGIIVLDLIDMEERRNRARVMDALQHALEDDKSPTKVLSFNDFGLVIMTRKRVKQSLERTLCSPCPYCTGAGLVKSPQTVSYEILDEARRLARGMKGDKIKQTTLRVHPEVARALRSTEGDVLTEIEAHLGAVDVTSDDSVHQEQFDFAVI